eukprot:scaffold1980_cov86-Skeletonema_marinoi.AAC.3
MAADGYFIYTGGEAVPTGVTRVRIDESLTVIPAYAFQGNRHIEEVDCHIGVKTVEEYAFFNCRSLRLVIMPGVEVVERGAFYSCKALTDVECDKLERIERCAFGRCISLGSINLPSAKIIQNSAFWNCTALTNIKFRKELESIRGGAFNYCTSLERITIPLKDGIITDDDIFRRFSPLSTPAGDDFDDGEKALAIRMWISSVLHKFFQCKAKHRSYLNEAATTLQLALPNDIVNMNVLPYLELPSYTFEGED